MEGTYSPEAGLVLDKFDLWTNGTQLRGANTWQPWNEGVNGFNFRYGENPFNTEETPNDLQDVIFEFWARNEIRPSDIN